MPEHRPTILIIDDAAVDRELVRRLIGADYNVVEAADAAGALVSCEREKPDCVILDYQLVDCTGLDLLPDLLNLDVAVVMLTGQGNETVAVSCLVSGAHDYLSKSTLSAPALRKSIATAIEKAQLLRESRLYRRLIRGMPGMVTVCRQQDPEQSSSIRITWSSPDSLNGQELFPGAVGQMLLECDPQLANTALPTAIADVSRSGKTKVLHEFNCAHGENAGESDASASESYYDLTIVPLPGGQVGIFAVDVSEQIANRRREADIHKQMATAQRMEAIGRLSGSVAHDFNNVLTVIRSHAEFCRDPAATAEQRQSDLGHIMHATEQAEELTNRLLAFSRNQSRELRPTNLNHVVEAVLPLLEKLIGADIQLMSDLQEDLGSVDADSNQIEQLLLNLAANARDAMPDGGALTICTTETDVTDEHEDRWHALIPRGSYVVLSVSDSGEGIDPLIQEHIFEPFFTSKPVGQGTGLGLASVHGIVEQSGGHIRLFSQPQEGAHFRIYLPRTGDACAAAPQDVPVAASPGGCDTILLAEDDELVRKVASRILTAAGYSVLVARDANDALKLAADSGNPPDLLITDLVMPGINGHELAQHVRQLCPGISTLFMSGYDAGSSEPTGGDQEIDNFLRKPFSHDDLRLAVRHALMARESTMATQSSA